MTMTPSNDVLSEYIPKPDLAKQLGRSGRTLDRWDRLNIGPPRTIIGRRTLYRRKAVEEWLLANEKAA